MAKSSATEQWQAFYEAAAQFRDAAPWRYVDDSMLTGVQNPDTGEIGWCCIMGNAGEHFALAVYKGSNGLDSYFELADAGMSESAFNPESFNAMFSQDCWMISFENAGNVSKEQKAHLKAIGLTFKGAGQWIVAETMDPGLDPWLPDVQDLPFLIHCMREALAVAERTRTEPNIMNDESYLIRTPVRDGGVLRWEDRYLREDELPESEDALPVQPSRAFLDAVKLMPAFNGAIAISNFFSPAPIQEKKGLRPWRPILLLGVVPGPGYILSQDLAPLPKIPGRLEQFLLATFKSVKGKPRQIGVHSRLMEGWLADICAQTDIELVPQSGDEDYFASALEALSGIMG